MGFLTPTAGSLFGLSGHQDDQDQEDQDQDQDDAGGDFGGDDTDYA